MQEQILTKILLAVFILLSTAPCAYCEVKPLKLLIKSDKDRCKAGDEVKLRVELRASEKALIGGPSSVTNLEVRNEKGEKIKGGVTEKLIYRGPAEPILISPQQPLIYEDSFSIEDKGCQIESGERYAGLAILYCAKDGIGPQAPITHCMCWPLDGPGKYTIKLWCRAELNKDKTAEFFSNPLQIEIAKNSDPIAELAKRLSQDLLWHNGLFPELKLPANASAEEVVEQVFRMTGFAKGRVSTYKLIEVRKVAISGEEFSAALAETDIGEKIVLFRYSPDGRIWWSRVYDAGKKEK